MASTIYRRPDLFPFSFASIADWASTPGYVGFGTTTDALQCLTNLLTFQVSVSWSFSWKYPAIPVVYDNSYSANINLPLFIPADAGSDNSSTIGWYNSDTIGTKRASPAARVLYSGTGGDVVQSAVTSNAPYGDDYNLQTYLRLSRASTVTRLAFYMVAVNFNSPGATGDPFNAGFESVPSNNLATVSIDLMGTSVPFYLKTGGPVAANYEILGPITFSATVTPTFAAA